MATLLVAGLILLTPKSVVTFFRNWPGPTMAFAAAAATGSAPLTGLPASSVTVMTTSTSPPSSHRALLTCSLQVLGIAEERDVSACRRK